jgi:D-alanine transaminase/branched-chain amino acid aminotransferase
MTGYVNSDFVSMEKASLQVTDLAIQRGFAIFDFFRTVNFIPLFLDDYLSRFYKSADQIGLNAGKSAAELRQVIAELISKNDIPEVGYKIILTGGCSDDGYHPAQPNFMILPYKLDMLALNVSNKSFNLVTYEYRRELPTIKSTNYLVGVWLARQVEQRKADDVLYVKDGIITEAPRSNIFIVSKEGSVVTPKEDVLEGITRKKIIELASRKLKVELRKVTEDELYSAAEVFLTSTTKRVTPVIKINDSVIGNGKPGEITQMLLQQFMELEERYIAQRTQLHFAHKQVS